MTSAAGAVIFAAAGIMRSPGGVGVSVAGACAFDDDLVAVTVSGGYVPSRLLLLPGEYCSVRAVSFTHAGLTIPEVSTVRVLIVYVVLGSSPVAV